MPTPPLSLTPAAHALAAHLHAELRGRWTTLPDASPPPPGPVPAFRAAPIPDDLHGRRAELIVEASDLPALRRALDSDADAVVIDLDDTFSPTRANVQAAYDALEWAATTGKPLLVRPRALYATEPHLTLGGPGIAALCDLSAILAARPGDPPHLYIPKLETVAEAQFWHDALTLAEAHLGLPADTVHVCLQIETFPGLLHAEALLHALHPRAYGLNAGRWDYVFSLVKHVGPTRAGPVPTRSQLTMDVPAMRAYAEHLVAVCREHGAEAIGGTASLAPDPADPTPALDAVRADKQREAAQGFTAAWAGLPELVGVVREGIASQSSETPQSASRPAPLEGSQRADHCLPLRGGARRAEGFTGPGLSATLTALPTPPAIPVAELRDSISLALDVFAAWLEGRGVVVRAGRVEDTATAELARALVWQWVRVGARLDDGEVLTPARYRSERGALMPDNAGASRLLDHLVLAEVCPAYFPREAQSLFPDLFQGVSP
ncbi:MULTISPECIES: aldolase/citrate lyase family protein [Deinococcus]|uniref:malate synthase n=1 Tax=Deinococcus rufus TaxID=2136097 RepID=A0ABV7Z4T8_9DEIO|nr:aldolase/citrate lyase family protein [Deinococcus sp. AB2017081]WQE95180.1 aldolase/citrate lyase family protein [Deinococcus sp. AB2017081]